MPDREIVSPERLFEILNIELTRFEECAECQFTGAVQPLPEPAADGCNWSRSLTLRGRPRNPQACGEAAAEVISLVAMRFNLG